MLGWKSVRRILGVEAHLDGRARGVGGACVGQRQLAGGLADHPLDEVDAGHLLGHAVLDLQARVHLEEVELLRCAASRRTRPCRPRRSAPRWPRRTAASSSAWRTSARRPGAGRLLDHLLVAPLGRAVALAEREDAALPVAEDLHLDVARALDEASRGRRRRRRSSAAPAAAPASKASASAAASRQTRMPMPPPPAVLLSITG